MSIICNIPKEVCNARESDGTCRAGRLCEKIVEQCIGCSHIENEYCKTYIRPATKWMSGNCPSATHIVKEVKESKKINPLKQSKKSSKK